MLITESELLTQVAAGNYYAFAIFARPISPASARITHDFGNGAVVANVADIYFFEAGGSTTSMSKSADQLVAPVGAISPTGMRSGVKYVLSVEDPVPTVTEVTGSGTGPF